MKYYCLNNYRQAHTHTLTLTLNYTLTNKFFHLHEIHLTRILRLRLRPDHTYKLIVRGP